MFAADPDIARIVERRRHGMRPPACPGCDRDLTPQDAGGEPFYCHDPECPDRGRQWTRAQAIDERVRRVEARQAARETTAAAAEALGVASIPPDFKLATLAKPPPDVLSEQERDEWNMVARVLRRALAAPAGATVVLTGPRGPGKTWLACGALADACRGGRSGLFSKAMEFFMAIKATYKPTARESELDVVRRFVAPEVLVMDETGRRGETEWENQLFDHLLDKRHENHRRTVMTNNDDLFDPDPVAQARKAAQFLGASVASRLTHRGLIVHCGWSNLRPLLRRGIGGAE